MPEKKAVDMNLKEIKEMCIRYKKYIGACSKVCPVYTSARCGLAYAPELWDLRQFQREYYV